MRAVIRRVLTDVKNLRQLEAYAVAAIATVLAVLSILETAVPENIKWAALLGGVGLLVYQVTLPERRGGRADDVLRDRSAFEDNPLSGRLRSAREVWIFAPSAINILSSANCAALRTEVLARSEGVVRVVVLDPERDDAVQLAIRQLDDSLDYPLQQFRESLDATVRQLRLMSEWQVPGTVDYRYLSYNPGFSLVAIDPGHRDGVVIVEMHGFHNDATQSRMHLELQRADSDRWYSYWLDQFSAIWNDARAPAARSVLAPRPPRLREPAGGDAADAGPSPDELRH